MTSRAPGVTVLSLSRGRVPLLMRAMDSVARQDYLGPIEHTVVVDDCLETHDAVALRASRLVHDRHSRMISAQFVARPPGSNDLAGFGGAYPRLARLLNQGVRRARTEWISLLHDDNENEPDHVRTLIERPRETNAAAGH